MYLELQALREDLEEFAQQPDYAMLVLRCDDQDVPIVLKSLEAVDQLDPDDLFLALPPVFDDAPRWTLHALALVQSHIDAANLRRKERGEPDLPPLPAACFDIRGEPRERLLTGIEYVRATLPDPTRHYLVVALLPAQVHDPKGYATLVHGLGPWASDDPRLRGVRWIVRDGREHGHLTAALSERPSHGALVREVNFGTEAMLGALEADAADPGTPMEARAAALLQLAMVDYGYKRYAQAAARYGVLYTYYGQQKQPAMQALCQLGVGDVLRDQGHYAQALERYQSGIAQAMDAQALPVLLNLLLSAGEAMARGRQYEEAASYFDSAGELASSLSNPMAMADAWERQGEMFVALHRHGDAVRRFREVEEVARAFEYWERAESVLLRQRAIFEHARMPAEQRAVDERVALVRDPERRMPWAAAARGELGDAE